MFITNAVREVRWSIWCMHAAVTSMGRAVYPMGLGASAVSAITLALIGGIAVRGNRWIGHDESTTCYGEG